MNLLFWWSLALCTSAQRYDDDSFSRESESSDARNSNPTPNGITFKNLMRILDVRFRKFEEKVDYKTDRKIADLREEFNRQLDELKNTGILHDVPTRENNIEDELEEKLADTNLWIQKLDNDFEAFQSRTEDSLSELGQMNDNFDVRASQLETQIENIQLKNTNLPVNQVGPSGQSLEIMNENKRKITELEDQLVQTRVTQINDERALENLNRTVETLVRESASSSSNLKEPENSNPETNRRLAQLEEDVRKIRTAENDELDELYDSVLESKKEQNSKISKLEKDLQQNSIDVKNYHEHEKNADLALAKKINEIERELEKEKNDLANFQNELGHGDLEFITKKIVDLGNDQELLYQNFESFKNEESRQDERLDSVFRNSNLLKESIANLQKTDEDFLFRLVDVETKLQDGYNPNNGGSSSISTSQISYQLNKFKTFLREIKSDTTEMQGQIKSLEDGAASEFSSIARNFTRHDSLISKTSSDAQKKCLELETTFTKLEQKQEQSAAACESKIKSVRDDVAGDLLNLEDKAKSNKEFCEDNIKKLSSSIIDAQEQLDSKISSVETSLIDKIGQSSSSAQVPVVLQNDIEKMKLQIDTKIRQIDNLKQTVQSCAKQADLLPLDRSLKALEISTSALSDKFKKDTESMDTLINKLSVEFHELELNFDKMMDSMNSQSSDTGVSSTVIAALEVKIDQVKTNYFDAEKDFQDFKNQLYILDYKFDNQNEKIKNMSTHSHSPPRELDKLARKIADLEKELEKAKKEGISSNHVQPQLDTTTATTTSSSSPDSTASTSENWGSWTSCSVTCGKGIKRRYNNNSSSSNRIQTVPCENKSCVNWSNWSSCSKSCGRGERRRENLLSMDIFDDNTQTELCNTFPCPAERPWSEWSMCTKTCGNGRRSRQNGIETDAERCNTRNCPGWTEWSECSASCDGGSKTRKYIEYNNSNIPITVDSQERVCNRVTCPWTQWSECSVTCGEGNRQRRRGDRDYTRKCYQPACIEVTTIDVTTPPPNGDGMIGEIVIIGGRRSRSDITGPRTVKLRDMID